MQNASNNPDCPIDIPRRSAVIDDALRSLRISGSVLLRERYSPPWEIVIPGSDELGRMLDVARSTRVVAFHLVEMGQCLIRVADDRRSLNAGEIIVTFCGAAHQLSCGTPAQPQSIATLLAGGPNIQRPNTNAEPDQTALLCGVFMLQHTVLNPLFASLPQVLQTSLSRPGELHNLSGVARLMAEEIDRESLGGGYVVERLLEVLCAEAIRAHIEAVPQEEASWIRGIKDPVVGRAIAAVHEKPGADWSVTQLADRVAMSPSRFAARFSASVGISPMAYLTKWRMSLACRELKATRHSIDQVATDLGYESPAAFSRTFKKHLGVSPAAWRAAERQ